MQTFTYKQKKVLAKVRSLLRKNGFKHNCMLDANLYSFMQVEEVYELIEEWRVAG